MSTRQPGLNREGKHVDIPGVIYFRLRLVPWGDPCGPRGEMSVLWHATKLFGQPLV